jgi:uncharacterized membrane protein
MFKKKQSNARRLWIFLFIAIITPLPLLARNVVDDGISIQRRLEKGEVVVDLKDVGKTKYVEAKVLINEPPDKVWPIMVNPFEFQGKISPRMKTVEVVSDQTNRSVLKVTLDVLLIPHFTYIVESLYENGQSVQFHRVGGILKDFSGSWVMSPAQGNKTELTYCMYIDPGFPVPQWIIREGVKSELPKTLIALRERVHAIHEHTAMKEKRTILAALTKLPHRNQDGLTFSEPLSPIHSTADNKHEENIRDRHAELAHTPALAEVSGIH